MYNNGFKMAGHNSLISCLKSHPTDPNILLTGGWDNTMKYYDIRARKPVCSLILSGAISGDSIDIYDDMIVTGSHKGSKDCMQMFSLSC